MPPRIGASLWLLAAILVVYWGSTAGFGANGEPPGVGGAATRLTSGASVAQPSFLPRDLLPSVTLATDRPKAGRVHRSSEGKRCGTAPAPTFLPILAGAALRPPLRHSLLRPTFVRAFDPRGPPNLYG